MSLADLTTPEKSRRDWLIVAFVFGLSILHFSFFYRYTLINADEGIVLQGAQRILEGQVLYRDFFSFFTPGSYYWIAFFFKLFGSSIEVGRAVLLVEGALLSVLTYLVARHVCSRWSAFVVSMLVTLTALPTRFLVLHNWDSTLWAFIALYCALLFLQRGGRLTLFATGWFAALTCLFEQSKGAGIVFGLGLGLAIILATDLKRRIFASGSLPILLLGFGLPFLITIAYFWSQHAIPQMVADWLWPLRNYTDVNKTSYGYVSLSSSDRSAMNAEPLLFRLFTIIVTAPWYIVPALPMAALAVLIYWIQRKGRADKNEAGREYYILTAAVVIGLLLSVLATGRPDFTHLVYLNPVFFVVLAWIIDGKMLPARIRRVLPAFTFFIIISCLGFGLALLSQPLNAVHTLNARRGTLKGVHPDAIVDYIQRNVGAGETMLVYPYLPLYYYLTATFSPSRYEYLQPGLHTREQVNELIGEVEKDQTRMIFFEPSFREKALSVFPATSTEVLSERDPMAEYIESHYRKCATLTSHDFWRFHAMVRKDLPCPDESQ